MEPVLRIDRFGALTVTLSNVSADEAALLRKLFLTSDVPERPAFNAAAGTFRIVGTLSQLQHCLARLMTHRQVPARIRTSFGERLDNFLRKDYTISLRGRTFDLGSRTHVMGILNVTPDSFSDGGRYIDPVRAVARARQLADEGADIIDVGGESTRPGAASVPEDEELRRIIPVIERISAELPVVLSVDTYKASVARRALAAGASLVNDISGLRFSPDMAKVVADHGAAVVLMHIKGTPKDMQRDPVYEDVVGEVSGFLEESIGLAVRDGVDRERILVDPGIGFGKALGHNLALLNRLDELRPLGRPLVIGTSRKRFIGTVLDQAQPEDRVMGTAATVALAIERGAHIIRVHDVAAMGQVARMTDAVVRQR